MFIPDNSNNVGRHCTLRNWGSVQWLIKRAWQQPGNEQARFYLVSNVETGMYLIMPVTDMSNMY